jgi:hypothetical protein
LTDDKRLEYLIQDSSVVAIDTLCDQLDDILNTGQCSQEESSKYIIKTSEAKRLARSMLSIYWQNVLPINKSLIPVFIEEPFCVPIMSKIGRPAHLYHKGVFELVLLDTFTGDLVLLKIKTTEGLPATYERRLEFDPQYGSYLYALRHTVRAGQVMHPITLLPLPSDTPVGRVIYDVIRRKKPTVPEITKKGLVSVKDIDTLPEIYRDALEKQRNRGIESTLKQRDILDRLEGRGHSPFFQRFEYYRNDNEIDEWTKDQWMFSHRLRALKAHPERAYRSPGACTPSSSPRCGYRMLCIEDTPDSRDRFFVIRKDLSEV